jgi:high-affinity iron transporter
MMKYLARLSGICLALLLSFGSAQALAAEPNTIWRLLDYMAVDYAAAVEDGEVVNELEYEEMAEFAGSVRSGIAELPERPGRVRLEANAKQFEANILSMAPVDQVATEARKLAADLLAIYPITLSPSRAPDLERGRLLYQENCASCHGVSGNGRGPASAGLDPPPIAFIDVNRARQRSIMGLYQVIDQGIDGTAMPGFSQLSSDDRWALAFYSGSVAFEAADEGARLWKSDSELRKRFPDLAALTKITPDELAGEIGQERADALMAYLRANPSAIADAAGPLGITRTRLAEAERAHANGNISRAKELALSAYLDGFEPVEPILATRNPDLLVRIESAMMDLRAAIDADVPTSAISKRIRAIEGLLVQAENVLAPESATGWSTFVASFAILLREGLEALLIVIAMIAFVRKARQDRALRFVHGGWTGALVAGALTWFAATYLLDISGAGRESIEAFGALIAALVLLSVGVWMHGKSQADNWQRYIRDKLGKALSRGSLWFLFGIVFLVVYREVFETILFYAALSAQGSTGYLLAGAATAGLLLVVIAWLLLRYSRTLPIGKFFAYSSVLIALLAIVLIGKGIAGLQEAGVIGIAPIAGGPRLSMLGVYPTFQVIGAQLAMASALLLGFWINHTRASNNDRSRDAV